MRPRTLLFIMLLVLCHLQVRGQTLTNGLPPSQNPASESSTSTGSGGFEVSQSSLPDDPGQEILPIAQPVPPPATGTPVEWQAQRQQWQGDTVTLSGDVVFHYRGYVLRADKVTYNRKSTELDAEGHLQVAGGPNDVLVNASHGNMRLDAHTARFYDVHGSQGVRTTGHTVVYSTTNPLLFSARVVIEDGEGHYKLIDGSFTNCRLPHPDWRIIAGVIALDGRQASTSNAFFKLVGVPVFYLPYLRHAVAENQRESGFLIPVVSTGSSIRGFTLGEQYYWVINRSMDMVMGAEYFSKRGWAPNGDFRYKGHGVDHLIARWNALVDRGIQETTPTGTNIVNQGGVDIAAEGVRSFSPYTRVGGTAEYLSSYVYRLIFNDNYAQATSSQVSSNVALVHARNGFVPSAALERFEAFASTRNGNEVRILHLPDLRYDVLTRPLGRSPLRWGMGSSLTYLSRSEPNFHARNVGRFDFYPHLTLPLRAGGWNFIAQGALRDTAYTISQTPNPAQFIPVISHSPLNRAAVEATAEVHPPALVRDFELPFGHGVLRHVIEPQINYHFVGGIGRQARNVLLFDTTDILTDTNQVGYSLTQHFYVRRHGAQPCSSETAPVAESGTQQADATPGEATAETTAPAIPCAAQTREWATWRITQDYYFDSTFGGALNPGQRNVFDSTLNLTGVAFLTSPRTLSPIISRMRFNAVPNLRVQWDFDYDPKRGQFNADNLFAGYSFGRTTVGVVHALLNAVDENTDTSGTGFALGTLQSQELQPFLEIGKPTGRGANLAVNGGYDFAAHTVQYAGVQAAYNWDCCGLAIGYRRFELGSVGTVSRDETQWLYSFTIANFGNVGDIRRANSVFRDPTLPPPY